MELCLGIVSVAESLNTDSAPARLVLNVMTAVSQWESVSIGERTGDAPTTNGGLLNAAAMFALGSGWRSVDGTRNQKTANRPR